MPGWTLAATLVPASTTAQIPVATSGWLWIPGWIPERTITAVAPSIQESSVIPGLPLLQPQLLQLQLPILAHSLNTTDLLEHSSTLPSQEELRFT